MKESYEKGSANRLASNPTPAMVTTQVWHGQEVHAGRVFSSEIITPACRPCPDRGKATPVAAYMASRQRTRRSLRPCACVEIPVALPREILFGFHPAEWHVTSGVERSENASGGTADMNANRKSDESVVPATSANNDAAEASAESIEERDSAKRNAEQEALDRTQSRTKPKSRGLHGVREAARKDSTLKFTALLHHVSEDCLTEAFFNLKRTAAVGVDGVTWQEYERNLEANIADLHGRIHRGAYRAQPSRRVWIPKPDGRQRPLGIASLEDKIVQQAVLWVLQSIYEQDFLGFSYGFRPGRSQHDALDALSVAITSKRVNWILDAEGRILL